MSLRLGYILQLINKNRPVSIGWLNLLFTHSVSTSILVHKSWRLVRRHLTKWLRPARQMHVCIIFGIIGSSLQEYLEMWQELRLECRGWRRSETTTHLFPLEPELPLLPPFAFTSQIEEMFGFVGRHQMQSSPIGQSFRPSIPRGSSPPRCPARLWLSRAAELTFSLVSYGQDEGLVRFPSGGSHGDIHEEINGMTHHPSNVGNRHFLHWCFMGFPSSAI